MTNCQVPLQWKIGSVTSHTNVMKQIATNSSPQSCPPGHQAKAFSLRLSRSVTHDLRTWREQASPEWTTASKINRETSIAHEPPGAIETHLCDATE